MKISVLVIAHNEEKHIAQCLESLLGQTKKADEIVLIVHNSTDRTKDIAEKYRVKVVPFNGPVGIPYARMKGLDEVSGDIILCLDGDSFAADNWIEKMADTLRRGNILVGSWVKLKGTVFGNFFNALTKYICATKGVIALPWIWGMSMAFWGTDKEKVRALWQNSILVSKELGLTRCSDDFWLSLYMTKKGNLEVTSKTHVIAHTKETTSWGVIKRAVENSINCIKIIRSRASLWENKLTESVQ